MIQSSFFGGISFQIYVFRYDSVPIEALTEAAQGLVDTTSYSKPVSQEEAPFATDCLTSIWYLFKKVLGVDIPLTFIGDMPRLLCSLGQWRVLQIEMGEARCGDILFVKDRSKQRLISHAALVIGVNQIFHNSKLFGTARIQPADDFFALYEQRLRFQKMIRYIDFRNERLRVEQGGIFLIG